MPPLKNTFLSCFRRIRENPLPLLFDQPSERLQRPLAKMTPFPSHPVYSSNPLLLTAAAEEIYSPEHLQLLRNVFISRETGRPFV
mmetsp:Transcript_17542/g.24405  ORF Transcript_17542/g.24405 Transcript_17542/m.24405 type:complete len:85 (+) Transcript_17542:279-533(+)